MIYLYKKWQKNTILLLFILALLGLADSFYLTWQKLNNQEVACSTFGGCNTVINSVYASLFGIPLAYLGLLYYLTIFILLVLITKNKKSWWLSLLGLSTLSGFFLSGYFVYLQIWEIGSICMYCMLSALTSTLLFIFTNLIYWSIKKAAK